MSDVRANAGTPVLAQFGGGVTPSACAPVVVDSTTGRVYAWKSGDVIVPQATGTGTASGTNTGDQDLSGLVPKTTTVNGKALSGNITLSLASADYANQGTATTVLHGSAAGNPAFGAVALAADVSGQLPVANGGTNIASYAAGDLLTATGATTLAKLAIGAANLKLFANAAGSAPEWASGIKVGFTTHDTSVTGTQAVTGLGFKPSNVLFIADIDATTKISWGCDDGSTKLAIYNDAGAYNSTNAKSVFLSTTAGVTNASALISSLDSDGFTLTWSKTGSPTGTTTLIYVAFR